MLALGIIREDHLMPRRFIGRIAAPALVLVTGLGAAVAFAADEPANIVKYRKAFMSANGAHLGMIAAAVKGEVSFTDEVAAHAHALAEQGKLLTADLQRLFPEGTAKGDVDTVALPAIWQQWGKFEQDAKNFATESAKMVEVAEGGDMAAIGQQLGALGKTCGGCHETFREKKS
jgi:cytochrome c556